MKLIWGTFNNDEFFLEISSYIQAMKSNKNISHFYIL